MLFIPLIINIMVITKALSPLSKAFQQALGALFAPLIINIIIITVTAAKWKSTKLNSHMFWSQAMSCAVPSHVEYLLSCAVLSHIGCHMSRVT